MKRLFAPIAVALALLFSLAVTAATIDKTDIIKGKWALSDEGVYYTVKTGSENGVDEYRVKVADYGDADFVLSFSCDAPVGTGEYTAVFFGDYNDGVFYGVGFLLGTGGVSIEESDGASVSVVTTESTADVRFEGSEGEAAFNDITVTRNGKTFDVVLNGTAVVTGYEPPEYFAASGGVYYGALTDPAAEKRFTAPDVKESERPAPASSGTASENEESSLPDAASSEETSSFDGKGGGDNDDIKTVAFVCLGVIGVVLLLAAVFTLLSRKGKNE